MENAFRLLLHHATTISFDSLLIYGSALFTSTAKFQQQVVEVEYKGPNYSRDSSHRLRARSEFVSALMPRFKRCLDFTPAVTWSPNSQHIAVSLVHLIEIRDVLSGSIVDSFDFSPTLEHVLDIKKVSRRCLAFYPDNSRIAYVTGGNRVHVWNTFARTVEFVVTGQDVDVSPNGKFLVSGSKSGRIQVCNAENGAPLWDVETGTKLKSTSISPNCQFVVSVSYSRSHGVRIWNAKDGRSLNILPYDAISVSFSADSNQLASFDQEGLVRVWELSQRTTKPVQEWSLGGQLVCPLFWPTGHKIFTANNRNVYVLRRDAHYNDHVARLDAGAATSLVFSADGLTLASASLDGTIRVLDISSIGPGNDTQDRGSIQDLPDGSNSVEISNCGQYLLWRTESRDSRTITITTRRIAPHVAQQNSFSSPVWDKSSDKVVDVPMGYLPQFTLFHNSPYDETHERISLRAAFVKVSHPEVTGLLGLSSEVGGLSFVLDHDIWVTGDNWVVTNLSNYGGRLRRLFKLPSDSEYHLEDSSWVIRNSWLSKRIFVRQLRTGKGNDFVVDFSALPDFQLQRLTLHLLVRPPGSHMTL
jgi:WD40 repeat protein